MNLVKFSRIKKAGETMATWLAIIFIVAALILGLIGGFLLARKYMMDYLKKTRNQRRNASYDDDANGSKPSQKKINQMMTMMNKNMDQNMKSAKSKFAIDRGYFPDMEMASFIIKLIRINMFIKIKVNKMTNRLRNAIIHFV